MKPVKVLHRRTESDSVSVNVYEPKDSTKYTKDAVVYIPGVGEHNRWTERGLTELASMGSRVICPDVFAGDDRRRAMHACLAMGEYRDSDELTRMVVTHSAGTTALGRDMSPDEASELAGSIQTLMIANPPFRPGLTKRELLGNFWNKVKSETSSGKSVLQLADEFSDLLAWSINGNILREVNDITGSKLPENLPLLAKEFGARLKIVIDKNGDVLCPPDDLLQAVERLPSSPNGRPQVIHMNNHSPIEVAAVGTAIVLRALQRIPRFFQRLKQKHQIKKRRKKRFR